MDATTGMILGGLMAATSRARTRTGDRRIGTHAKAGTMQVVRVEYTPRGMGVVTCLSGWLSAHDAIEFLDAMPAMEVA